MLPVNELNRLSPNLELTPMPLGKVYYEANEKLQHVYFPTTSIISLHYIMENGAQAEIAAVGKEGMLGISVFMGGSPPPSRASVRAAGFGFKLKARSLMEEFNRAGSLQRMLLRYTQALLTQTSQTAVCNRHHTVSQQLCRWLLMTHDRVPSNELVITQELIANMIGVRREGIMEALGKLKQNGIIFYRYGHITILNRSALEEQACECYNVVKAELDRLLGIAPDWRPVHKSVNSYSVPDIHISSLVRSNDLEHAWP
jgi:CRP-like cAMP-binding protein